MIFLLAGDFVKFGFPMALTTTLAAWSVFDYSLGYSSAGNKIICFAWKGEWLKWNRRA